MRQSKSSVTTFGNSTAISSAVYNHTTKALTLRFKSGSTYRYKRVPSVLYGGLCSAPSAGTFARIYLLGKFPVTRVKPSR
jgi:hypothetical protein